MYSQKFLDRKILYVFLNNNNNYYILSEKNSKSSNIVKFLLFKITAFYLNIF